MSQRPTDEEASRVTEAELKRWIEQPPDDPITRRWRVFHKATPRVYQLLVRYTREAISAARERGRDLRRYGIQAVAERVRWHVLFEARGEDDFKVSNDFLSRYAREIMTREPDLRGVFELRTLRPVIQPTATTTEKELSAHDK